MRDSLDRSVTWWGMAWRTALTILAVALAVPLSCVALHNVTHPAPLGRSENVILRRVDAALPLGSTVDSAAAFFRAQKVQTDFYRAADVPPRFGNDSLAAGGPVLIAVLPDIARGLYVWDGIVELYFSAENRLAARRAYLSAVAPL